MYRVPLRKPVRRFGVGIDLMGRTAPHQVVRARSHKQAIRKAYGLKPLALSAHGVRQIGTRKFFTRKNSPATYVAWKIH